MANPPLKIRDATIEDASALANLEIAARTESDESWRYRFPHRYEYPDEHRHFTRQRHISSMSPESPYFVLVAELPSTADPSVGVPVALAVYSLANVPADKGGKAESAHANATAATPTGPQGTKPSPLAVVARPDADPARNRAFIEAHNAAKKRLLDDVYGDNFLYLLILAVHPDYQRMGVGRRLCQYGIDFARERGLKVALFATAMGEQLYAKLGFRVVGEMVTRADGEDAEIRSRGMVLDT